jgi:SAM-dependent methyltransferase
MMVESKAWNWNVVTDSYWNEASEDIFYYLFRWKSSGFIDVLDLGCGLGRNSLVFSENGFNVDAFDLSPYAMKIWKNSQGNVG